MSLNSTKTAKNQSTAILSQKILKNGNKKDTPVDL